MIDLFREPLEQGNLLGFPLELFRYSYVINLPQCLARVTELLAFEDWFAFADVCIQSFLRVFRLEELLLQLALERQRRLERYFTAGLYGTLDSADCCRGFIWSGELACILNNL